jgi:hypothetical protein
MRCLDRDSLPPYCVPPLSFLGALSLLSACGPVDAGSSRPGRGRPRRGGYGTPGLPGKEGSHLRAFGDAAVCRVGQRQLPGCPARHDGSAPRAAARRERGRARRRLDPVRLNSAVRRARQALCKRGLFRAETKSVNWLTAPPLWSWRWCPSRSRCPLGYLASFLPFVRATARRLACRRCALESLGLEKVVTNCLVRQPPFAS